MESKNSRNTAYPE